MVARALGPKLVPARTLASIRSSRSRWQALRTLLGQLQRLAQTSLTIDLTGHAPGRQIASAAVFQESLEGLERAIAQELSRLTVEGLQVELLHQQRKDILK